MLLPLLAICLVSCAGCTTTSRLEQYQMSPGQDDEEKERQMKDRMVAAARRWYGLETARVVVESRSPDHWTLQVGPEIKAATVEIDTITLKVVNVSPGF